MKNIRKEIVSDMRKRKNKIVKLVLSAAFLSLLSFGVEAEAEDMGIQESPELSAVEINTPKNDILPVPDSTGYSSGNADENSGSSGIENSENKNTEDLGNGETEESNIGSSDSENQNGRISLGNSMNPVINPEDISLEDEEYIEENEDSEELEEGSSEIDESVISVEDIEDDKIENDENPENENLENKESEYLDKDSVEKDQTEIDREVIYNETTGEVPERGKPDRIPMFNMNTNRGNSLGSYKKNDDSDESDEELIDVIQKNPVTEVILTNKDTVPEPEPEPESNRDSETPAIRYEYEEGRSIFNIKKRVEAKYRSEPRIFIGSSLKSESSEDESINKFIVEFLLLKNIHYSEEDCNKLIRVAPGKYIWILPEEINEKYLAEISELLREKGYTIISYMENGKMSIVIQSSKGEAVMDEDFLAIVNRVLSGRKAQIESADKIINNMGYSKAALDKKIAAPLESEGIFKSKNDDNFLIRDMILDILGAEK